MLDLLEPDHFHQLVEGRALASVGHLDVLPLCPGIVDVGKGVFALLAFGLLGCLLGLPCRLELGLLLQDPSLGSSGCGKVCLPLFQCLLLVLLLGLVFCDTPLVLDLVVKLLELLQILSLAALALFFQLKVSQDPAFLLLVFSDALLTAVALLGTGHFGLVLPVADSLDQFAALGLAVVRDQMAAGFAFVLSAFERGEAV